MRLGSWLRPLLEVVAFGGVLWAVIADASSATSAHLWQTMGVVVLGQSIGHQIASWRLKRPAERWSVVASGALTVALAIVVTEYSAKWIGPSRTLTLVTVQAALVATAELMTSRRRVRLADGSTFRLTKPALMNVVLGRTSGAEEIAAYGIGGRHDVTGNEAVTVIRALSDDLFGKTSAGDVERGWLLLRQHGNLVGLIDGLDAARPESNGRHSWPDVPMPWRVALHIGAIEATGSRAEQEALRTKIRDASGVASIAESLEI